MSKFKKGYRELSGLVITRHAINAYEKHVLDDPILGRHHTAVDIERRIRKGVNQSSEVTTLNDGTVVYRAQFTKGGVYYHILTKPNQFPVPVVGVWTADIFQNYLAGITSKGGLLHIQ